MRTHPPAGKKTLARPGLQLYIRQLFTVVFSAILIVVVWREWPRLLQSFNVLAQRSGFAVFETVPLVLLGCLFAALSYWLIALKPVPFRELVVVEFAAAFVNRVLPSGLGGLGVHGLYLHKRKHTIAQAVSVATTNNLLGMVVHGALLGMLLFARPETLGRFHLGWSKYMGWILLGIVCMVIFFMCFRRLRQSVVDFSKKIIESLKLYRSKKLALLGAGLCLAGLTLCNVAVFAAASHMVDIKLGFAAFFAIYTVGVATGAAVPTPGGLGGVEAGLLAGLIASGAESTPALAAVLAFRLTTFWLPLVLGAAAFFYARSRRLF